MKKRISITPKEGLLKVPGNWRRKIAEEATEVLIQEGRYREMMARISGLTLADLTDEATDDTFIKKYKPSKSGRNEPVKKMPSIEPETSEPASYIVTASQEANIRVSQIDLF